MKTIIKISALIFGTVLFLGGAPATEEWKQEQQKGYTLFYTNDDEPERIRYNSLISHGIVSVQFFMKDTFNKAFQVYVHPNRKSLDKQWQKDWKMPEFKSECWMVASGVANKLDLLSPLVWKTEACEHVYAEKETTQKLITHELFHVFHAQKNPSADFSETEDLDWFVEGFATYASGQCTPDRIKEVQQSIAQKIYPQALKDFWKGKMKYGLSGSMVEYLDKTYGRKMVSGLLKFTKKSEVLNALKVTENVLIAAWVESLKNRG